MAGHCECLEHMCRVYAVQHVSVIVDRERMYFLQAAGNWLHIDPILYNALYPLPSLHKMNKGDTEVRVDYPLKGMGSAAALDYAIFFLQVYRTYIGI